MEEKLSRNECGGARINPELTDRIHEALSDAAVAGNVRLGKTCPLLLGAD